MSRFVEDLQETKSFYQNVFDAQVMYEDEVSAGVKFENVILNLLHISEAPALVRPGVVASRKAGSRFQLSIWVDDVDAVCADLEKHGVTLLSGPENKEWGMRAATFTDPAGHSWEVAQNLDK